MTLENLNKYVENRLSHHKDVLKSCKVPAAKMWVEEIIKEFEILSDLTSVTQSRTSQPIKFAEDER